MQSVYRFVRLVSRVEGIDARSSEQPSVRFTH